MLLIYILYFNLYLCNVVIQNKGVKLQLRHQMCNLIKALRLVIIIKKKLVWRFLTSKVHSSSLSPSSNICVSLYTFPISSCNGDTLNSILCKLKPIPTPIAFKKLSFRAYNIKCCFQNMDCSYCLLSIKLLCKHYFGADNVGHVYLRLKPL